MKQIGTVLSVLLVVSCFTPASQDFQSLIGLPPSEDVQNLNVYGDELGIDASYWLSFRCNDSTIEKIITTSILRKIKMWIKGCLVD